MVAKSSSFESGQPINKFVCVFGIWVIYQDCCVDWWNGEKYPTTENFRKVTWNGEQQNTTLKFCCLLVSVNLRPKPLK